MKFKIKKKNIIIFSTASAVVLCFALIICFLYVWESVRNEASDNANGNNNKEETVDLVNEDKKDMFFYNGKLYKAKENLETVLIIGVDKFQTATLPNGYNNNQQCDFLMLLVLDNEKKSYSLLQINRDTMTNIPVLGVRGEYAGSMYGQLALSHTYGSGGRDSCRNTVKAVENFLYGIDIEHFVSFTMDAAMQINDAVGGVKITIPDYFKDIYDDLPAGQTINLNGLQALEYVRARGELDDDSNISRMERQSQYLAALKEQIIKKASEDENFFLKTLGAVSDYMVSDCTANKLADIYNFCFEAKYNGIIKISGEAVKGDEFMEFYAYEDELKDTVIKIFYEPNE